MDTAGPDVRPTPRGSVLLVRRLASSIRTRVLLTVVVVLLVGLAGTALGTRQVLLARVDSRVDDQLAQEVEELRLFAEQGLDPATGQPFGDRATRLLEVFVARNVPTEGEVILAFVDGRLVARTLQEVPYRVDRDPALVAALTGATDAARRSADTPAGRLEYLVVPVRQDEVQRGLLVVGVFRDVVAAEVDQAVAATAVVALVALLLGLATAVGLSRRILAPLEQMTAATATLGEGDLSRRLDVAGHDEVAQLASAFDGMLDRLQTAFDLQRQFVDDAGHELRTPITVVRGHLELLARSDEHDERAGTIALVLDELDRMRRIVDDLLVLARADQPDFVVPAQLELDELLTVTLRKATTLSQRHAWRLDEVPVRTVVADEQRLAQALLQLAHNAVQHTPAGTTVWMGAQVRGDDVLLWVRDDGPGVAAADRERVFERFARGADGRRPAGGAGLGLAIVRAITDGHGGAVRLDDEAGHGARFELHLPAAASVDAAARDLPAAAS